MASASGLATGYGPQVHGTSINTFNGSQLFPKFQQDLQKNCPFQHFNLMSDNADDKFEAMCDAIEELKDKEKKEGKGSGDRNLLSRAHEERCHQGRLRINAYPEHRPQRTSKNSRFPI